jgi:hypothetical protein
VRIRVYHNGLPFCTRVDSTGRLGPEVHKRVQFENKLDRESQV